MLTSETLPKQLPFQGIRAMRTEHCPPGTVVTPGPHRARRLHSHRSTVRPTSPSKAAKPEQGRERGRNARTLAPETIYHVATTTAKGLVRLLSL